MPLKQFLDNSAKLKDPLSLILKIFLVIAIGNAIYQQEWNIFFVNFLLLILIFIPDIFRLRGRIEIPPELEFIFLLFITASFFLGILSGFIVQILIGLTIGFIGFIFMFILYSNNKIKTNYFLIAVFSFSLSVTLGWLMESFKYIIKFILFPNYNGLTSNYTIVSLGFVSIGGLFASLTGYVYMKYHRIKFMDDLLVKFVRKNPKLFVEQSDSFSEILKMIKKGETKNIEFKETLRKNLHTGQIDKRMEHAVLKTIAGFLNTSGGTLLIGISDKGEVTGIEKDEFESKDKFNLHFTNLIKSYIGRKYLPFLNFELIQIEDKHIMKVDCVSSNKPVFLKFENSEEFYIRTGAATTLISGSELVEYIETHFKK
jgi:hypothetical protein